MSESACIDSVEALIARAEAVQKTTAGSYRLGWAIGEARHCLDAIEGWPGCSYPANLDPIGELNDMVEAAEAELAAEAAELARIDAADRAAGLLLDDEPVEAVR